MRRSLTVLVLLVTPFLFGFEFVTFHTDQPTEALQDSDLTINTVIYGPTQDSGAGTMISCLWLRDGWSAYAGSSHFVNGAFQSWTSLILHPGLSAVMDSKYPVVSGNWRCFDPQMSTTYTPDGYGTMTFNLHTPGHLVSTEIRYAFATAEYIRSEFSHEISRHTTHALSDLHDRDQFPYSFHEWELLNPAPRDDAWFSDIAYTDGYYVIVGGEDRAVKDAGQIVITPDLETYDRTIFEDVTHLSGVAVGEGVVVAVSTQSEVMVSDDIASRSWTIVDENIPALGSGLRTITHGHNGFVAAGDSGVIAWSPDGYSWSHTRFASQLFGASAYGNGIYVVGGRDAETQFFSSTNGQDWTQTVFGDHGRVRGMAYGNGMFVASGSAEAHWSTNGAVWNTVSLPTTDDTYGVTFGDGVFVIVGETNQVFVSQDAVNWYNRQPGTGLPTLYGVTYGGGRFVAVGDDNIVVGLRENTPGGGGGGGCNTGTATEDPLGTAFIILLAWGLFARWRCKA